MTEPHSFQVESGTANRDALITMLQTEAHTLEQELPEGTVFRFSLTVEELNHD